MSEVLDFFRELEPRFKSVPDAELNQFIYETYPDFLKDPGFRRDMRRQIGSERIQSESALENTQEGLAASGEAITRGAGNIAGSIGQFSKQIGRLVDSPLAAAYGPTQAARATVDAVEASGLGNYLRSLGQVAQEIPAQTSTDTIADAYRSGGLGSAARETGAFVAEKTLEQVPNMVQMALGAGAASKLLGLAPKAASSVGLLGTVFPQESGSAYEEIVRRSGRDDALAAAAGLGVGAVNTAMERIGAMPILERALDPLQAAARRSIAKSLANIGLGTLGESATEGGQELTAALAPELFGAERDPNLAGRLVEASAAGGVGGLGLATAEAGANLIQNRRAESSAYRQLLDNISSSQLVGGERAPVVDPSGRSWSANQFDIGQLQLAEQMGLGREAAERAQMQAAFDEAERLRIAEENRLRSLAGQERRMSNAERRAAMEAALNAPTPPAQQGDESVATFKTAKGSEYALFGDGTTQRNKAARPEHPGDSGIKDRTAKTIYVSPDFAREVGMWQTSSSTGKRVILRDGKVMLVSDVGGRTGRDQIINDPSYSEEPRVGMSPLELFQLVDPQNQVYRGTHPGNAITEIVRSVASAPTEERQVQQYPPDSPPAGSIPSAEELARREARRLEVAARNRAEAEARRAEAAARGEIGAVADLLSEQEELQASRFPAAQRPIGPESAASLLPGNLMERLRAARQQDEQQLQQIQRMAEIVRNAPPQQTPLQMAAMLQQRSQSLPPTPSLPRDTGAASPTGGAVAAPAILQAKRSKPQRITTRKTNANQVKEAMEVAGGEPSGPAPRVAEGEAAAVQEPAKPQKQTRQRLSEQRLNELRAISDAAAESPLFTRYDFLYQAAKTNTQRAQELATMEQDILLKSPNGVAEILALRSASERADAPNQLANEQGRRRYNMVDEVAAAEEYERRILGWLNSAIAGGKVINFSTVRTASGVTRNDQRKSASSRRIRSTPITQMGSDDSARSKNVAERLSSLVDPNELRQADPEEIAASEGRDIFAGSAIKGEDAARAAKLVGDSVAIAEKKAGRKLTPAELEGAAAVGMKAAFPRLSKRRLEYVGPRTAAEVQRPYNEKGVEGVRAAFTSGEFLLAPENAFTGNQSLSEGSVTLQQALDTVLRDAPADSLVRSIAQKLLAAGVNPQVVVLGDSDFDALGPNLSSQNALYQTETDTIYVRQSSAAHDYLVMHEAVHAATVYALRNNAQFLSDILALRSEAQQRLGSSAYGLQNRGDNFTDAAEFVAEALSNEAFQDQLKQIRITPTESLWDRFKSLIKRLFGSLTPQETTLLDLVLETTTREFAPNRSAQPASQSREAALQRVRDVLGRASRKLRNEVNLKLEAFEPDEDVPTFDEIDALRELSEDSDADYLKDVRNELRSVFRELGVDRVMSDAEIANTTVSRGRPYDYVFNGQKYKSGEWENLIGGRSENLMQGSLTQEDARYLDLARRYEAGDQSVLPELQQMVDEAAKRAGYDTDPLYHGASTDRPPIEVVDPLARPSANKKRESGPKAFWTTPNEEYARNYGGRVYKVYAKKGRIAGSGEYLTEAGGVPVQGEDPQLTKEQFVDYVNRFGRYPISRAAFPQADGSYIFGRLSKADPAQVYDNWGRRGGPTLLDMLAYTDAGLVSLSHIGNSSDRAIMRDIMLENGFDTYFTNGWGRGEFALLRGGNQIKSADPITRDSAGNIIPLSQRFDLTKNSILYAGNRPLNAADVAQMLQVPQAESQQHVRNLARARKELVPQSVSIGIKDSLLPTEQRRLLEQIEATDNVDERRRLIDEAKAAGFDYRAYLKSPERSAEKMLAPVFGIADITEENALRLTDMPDATDEQAASKRNVAASVDEAASMLEAMRDSSQASLEKLRAKAEDPNDPLNKEYEDLKSYGKALDSTAGAAVRSYEQYQSDLRTDAELRGESQSAAVLDSGARATRVRANARAVGQAMAKIAESIDKPTLDGFKTNEELLQAVRERGILVGNDIEADLLPNDDGPGILGSYQGLLRAVRHLHDLKFDADATAKRLEEYQSRFRQAVGSKAKGRVTLPQWIRAYNEWVENLDGLERVGSAIAKRTKAIKTLELKAQMLDRVLQSPEFKAQKSEAVRLIGKMYELVEGELDERTGDRIYRLTKGDNDKENVFRFKSSINSRADMMANVNEAARGIARINEILARGDISPETRETLKTMLLKFHQEGEAQPDGSLWYGALDFVRLFRMIPIAKSFVTANVAGWFTSGRLGKELRAAQQSIDRVFELVRRAQANGSYGRNAQIIAAEKAVKSHIQNGDIPAEVVKAGRARAWWDENILNPLLAANQSYQDQRLEVGQYTEDGYKITPEDMRAAKLQVRFIDELYKINEGGGAVSASPTRISYTDHGDQMLRKAVATGPMTMPRVIPRHSTKDARSYSVLDLTYRWLNAKTKEEKLAIMEDVFAFSILAKKYVGNLSSELKRNSPFEKAYVSLATEWRNNGTGKDLTFDDLINELESRVAELENETEEQKRERIIDTLFAELDKVAQKFSQQKQEDDQANARIIIDGVFLADPTLKNNPDGMVLTQLDAENSFTKPRKGLAGPSGWYEYVITPSHAYGAISKAATLKLTMRQLAILRQIEARAKDAKQQLMSRSGDWRQVDTKDLGIDKGDQVYNLQRLDSLIRLVDIVKENLRDTVTIRPSASESRTMWSMLLDEGRTQLLASPPVLIINAATGTASARWIVNNALYGRSGSSGKKLAKLAGLMRLPFSVVSTSIDAMQAVASKVPGMKEWIEANRSKVGSLLSGMTSEMEAAIRARELLGEDYSSLAQMIEARGIGPDAFDQGYKSESKAVKFLEALGAAPVIRHVKQTMPWAIGKSERAQNLLSAMYIDRSLRLYFGLLSKIIQARIDAGRSDTLDFAKPQNRFTASELSKLGISPDTWARTNTLFNSTKGIEEIALDYYKAVQEAKKKGKAVGLIPFTDDPYIYGDVVTRFAGLINLPLRSNRPDVVKARTSFGDMLRGFLFPGWANGWLSTLQFVMATRSDKTLTPAIASGLMTMAAMAAAMLAYGIPSQLLRKFLYEFWQGRPYPVETIADFARTPNAQLGARVAGSAIAGSIPYMGEYIASLFGAQNYKSDPTSLVNMHQGLKMANAMFDSVTTIIKTQDFAGATMNMARNVLPMASPLLGRIPDIQASRLSADAVRVARLNRGSIEVPSRLQGSSYGAQPSEFGVTINKALAASAAGDMGRAAQLLAKAEELNPGAARAAIQARRPEYKAFGRRLTEEEKAGLLRRMSTGQREIFTRAETAVDALLSLAPSKTATTQRSRSPIARVSRRLRAVRAARQPKALKAVRSKIRAIRPPRLASGSSGGGSSLLRPVRQGQAGRLVRPASLRMPTAGV